MDFSCLDDLPTYNDRLNNHENIPYPNLQIISGKTGSGKTHILLLELLTPDFPDYEELYVLSLIIHQKKYQFLKIDFEKHIDKLVLLNFFPRLNRFRINQLDEVFEIIDDKSITGADRNVLLNGTVKKLQLSSSNGKIRVWDNFPIAVLMKQFVTYSIVCYSRSTFFAVNVPHTMCTLMSLDLCHRLGIISEIASVNPGNQVGRISVYFQTCRPQ